MTDNANYLKQVREQYEGYPYPPRAPQEEKLRIITSFAASLDLINHYCFEGQQTFDNDFKVLIAGGGTGDSVIYLAEQLREKNARLTYVDISQASLDIAKKRAEIRGLTNITWHHGSLLNLSEMGLGPFDFIDCSGVLHHLENPEAGLASLTSVLKKTGAMSIMLYAEYGRTGIYHMQELMRLVNDDTDDVREKIRRTKHMLQSLPESHSMKKYDAITFGDDDNDIGIFDALLHSQDRAYTISQLYEYFANEDLTITHFLSSNGLSKKEYNPLTYINNPSLREAITELDTIEQQAIAELIVGDIFRHNVFVTQTNKEVPSPANLEMVPFFSNFFFFKNAYKAFADYVSRSRDDYIKFTHKTLNVTIRFEKTKLTPLIFKYFDGNRTIGEIVTLVLEDARAHHIDSDESSVLEEFISLYQTFHNNDWMLLRHKKTAPYKATVEELQRHFRSDKIEAVV